MNTLKPRNPFAHSPLLKKGGAHQRSQSSARFAGKQHLLAELDDWYDSQQDDYMDAQCHDTQKGTAGKPGCGPVFLRLPFGQHHAITLQSQG
ncbi:hypothetical protein PQU95_07575 [Vogesella sp. DC21W]|uniref:Uncharacterized protein n=1 Tax=Vogesella aquatica TaxID=2984206 RepID=A0ABT5IWZ3_9NEIS|nr:hypothetical protein [Vogesella aquatica]MDC7717075.1 hypothetical protein [Vogesella aquatica]